MTPADYEAWYDTPRGRRMGDAEYSLLLALLHAERGSSVLDVGCGTGHFTRPFARDVSGLIVGVDPDRERLAYAAARAQHGERYVSARAEALPFPDRTFDCAVSVTALCFVRDQRTAVRELLRVTRRRFVIGLLNRTSLLYLRKGRRGGSGGYVGAHWHTAAEVRALLESMPVANVVVRTAVFLPNGGRVARAVEWRWLQRLPVGGFLAVAGDVLEQ